MTSRVVLEEVLDRIDAELLEGLGALACGLQRFLTAFGCEDLEPPRGCFNHLCHVSTLVAWWDYHQHLVPCLPLWHPYVTSVARPPSSGTTSLTATGAPAGAGTRTCRRCASWSTAPPRRSPSAPSASRRTRS